MQVKVKSEQNAGSCLSANPDVWQSTLSFQCQEPFPMCSGNVSHEDIDIVS